MNFPADYNEIIDRINAIDPVEYAKSRNYINGAVTYLSPYISRGVISINQIREKVLNKGYTPRQIEKFLQELAWREYFQRVWQEKGDAIFTDLKQPQDDVQHHQMITSVADAATGVVAIDKMTERLCETGYMHNHVRMYIASIMCNIGKAHWLQPSRWMYYHLLDGDLASNSLSWQWVAGTFASKKYYCNQENINKFTCSTQQDSFLNKSYNHLASMPVPDILTATHDINYNTKLPETPCPVIDDTKSTLLYNSYNLDPLWRAGEDVNRVLLLEPSHFRQYPVSKNVIDFFMQLARNISGIQIFCGTIDMLSAIYSKSKLLKEEQFIAKEHPSTTHYPGKKDNRDWMFPQVRGYHPSFFSYWKKCERYL